LDFITPYARLIEQRLQSLDWPDSPESLYEPQRYVLRNGGKRIRPIFTLMACGLCGGNTDESLPAATAVELIHNFTLLHDDIMDQADSRRGNPTVHKKWDVSTAILAGDGMFVNGLLELLNYSDKLKDANKYNRLNRIILDAVKLVCEGQALDMEFADRDDVTTDEYLQMIGGKTAQLLSASLRMGGIVAGASENELESLHTFGMSAGLAFQIQDDLLDIIGDPEKFGKVPMGDIRECKKTYLMLLALERCTNDERTLLNNWLQKKQLNDDETDAVMQYFKKYSVMDTASELMNFYYEKAKESLIPFADSNYKADLLNVLIYLQNREK
jgi:geranylgeranyl diphosphate synthase type II